MNHCAIWQSDETIFLTGTLKKSIFGQFIHKLNVKRLLASFFMQIYLAGLNTLRYLSELWEPKLGESLWVICRALRPLLEFSEISQSMLRKTAWKLIEGKNVKK